MSGEYQQIVDALKACNEQRAMAEFGFDRVQPLDVVIGDNGEWSVTAIREVLITGNTPGFESLLEYLKARTAYFGDEVEQRHIAYLMQVRKYAEAAERLDVLKRKSKNGND